MTSYAIPKHIKLNYKFQKKNPRDFKFSSKKATTLPPSYDLRTVLKDPIVFDQGDLGSCTANASALAYMFHLEKQKIPVFTPSRLFIYANSRILEGTDLTNDSGCDLRDVMAAIQQQHVCWESNWPYVSENYFVKPSDDCYALAKQHHSKFQYLSVDQNIDDIKRAIFEGNAVVFAIQVYESFESDEAAKTGVIPMPDVNKEQYIGGHCVILVSFNDEKQSFLAQNSWGESWGIGGCFWIPYEYVSNSDLASDFWVMEVVS